MARYFNIGDQFFYLGLPADAGFIYVYESGTDVLKDTFNGPEQKLSQKHSNPIELSGDGKPPNVFFTGIARMRVTTKLGVLIEDKNSLGGDTSGGAFQGWDGEFSYDDTAIVTGSDGNFYASLVNNNLGNDPTTPLPTKWKQLTFTELYNANVTYGEGAIVKEADGLMWRSEADGNLGNTPSTNRDKWKPVSEIDLYDAAVTYPLGKVLQDSVGLMWRSLVANNLNNTPDSSPTKWGPTAVLSSVTSFPQNSHSADYTLTIDDAGKHQYHPASDTTARVFTIPANASVAYDIGTLLVFVNEEGAGTLRVDVNSDVLEDFEGNTGTAVLSGGNMLTALKVTATKWLSWLEDKQVSFDASLGIAHEVTPYVTAYSWSTTGYGTKYSDPASLPTGNCQSIAFSPSGTEVAVGAASGRTIQAWPFSGAGGFGTRFSDPTTGLATVYDLAFSPAGTELAGVGGSASPYIDAWAWSPSGFGTKYSDPASPPAGFGLGVDFSPAGTEIAVGHNVSPYITAFPWSPSGFGTKFANPGTLPANGGKKLKFSPAGTEVVMGNTSSPYIDAWAWSPSGFGTKFSNPGTLPPGAVTGLDFHPAGDALAFASGSSPGIHAYAWSASGFGTKYADPVTATTISTVQSVAFSPSGGEVTCIGAATPFTESYIWGLAGFGDKLAAPTTPPTGSAFGIDFVAL